MQKEQKLLNWILVFLCDTITLPGKTRLKIYGSGNQKESQRISVVTVSHWTAGLFFLWRNQGFIFVSSSYFLGFLQSSSTCTQMQIMNGNKCHHPCTLVQN